MPTRTCTSCSDPVLANSCCRPSCGIEPGRPQITYHGENIQNRQQTLGPKRGPEFFHLVKQLEQLSSFSTQPKHQRRRVLHFKGHRDWE